MEVKSCSICLSMTGPILLAWYHQSSFRWNRAGFPFSKDWKHHIVRIQQCSLSICISASICAASSSAPLWKPCSEHGGVDVSSTSWLQPGLINTQSEIIVSCSSSVFVSRLLFFKTPPFSGETALVYVLTNSIQGEQVFGKIKYITGKWVWSGALYETRK